MSQPNEPKEEVVDNDTATTDASEQEDVEETESKDESSQTEPAEEPEAEPVEPEVIELSAEQMEIQRLRGRIDQLDAQLLERTEQLRKVSRAFRDKEAEMDSFRDRMRKQGEVQAARRANEVVQAIFEPVQNLKRSVEMGAKDPSTLVAGLEMTLKQFMSALERLGLAEVPGVGADFDPQVHEALAVTPVNDPEQDGKVLMVHATGYVVGTKLLQPAQVIIGKYAGGSEPAEA